MHKRIYVIAITSFLFLAGCQNKNPNLEVKLAKDPGAVKEDVIYGNDDRLDLYEVTNQEVLALANSTVALIQSSKLRNNNGTTVISTSNFGSAMNLCPSEKYRDQPTAAFCSGTLVGSDLVLTAGHCISSSADCTNTKFVFGFGVYQKGVNPSQVPTSEVYGCGQIIHTERNDRGADFAVIKLDRPVANHPPLPVRAQGGVGSGDDILVIGYPVGLPTKVAAGAKVRSVSSEYFVANLDTYGGNSGSGVFNAHTGLIEGVLVRGEQDFASQGSCQVSKVCTDSSCRGEDVTQISKVLPYLPVQQTNPSPTPQPQPSPSPGQQDKYEAKPNLNIPDKNLTGVSSLINVLSAPNGRKVFVSVNISHTWIGDLIVTLKAADGKTIKLSDRAGGSIDNIVKTYELPKEFSEIKVNGPWKLSVSDTEAYDVGTLNSWSVMFQSRQG
ncbi:MAG: trypsin-like peptidase domain-containing protein [Oligoflexia bacterium]|nr:trypsin-like peptidase domain-containing protein [Oligoflexia bacterium]